MMESYAHEPIKKEGYDEGLREFQESLKRSLD